jgi:hypothetical protein
VCDAVAIFPFDETHPIMITTGFIFVIFLRLSMNSAPWTIPSRYIHKTCVCSSFSNSLSKSVSSIFVLFQSEKKVEKPRFLEERISVIATAMAPDCDMIPIFPLSKKLPPKLRFNF